jgi:hypothetical protein
VSILGNVRWVRRALAAICSVTLVSGLGLLYLRQPPRAFTASDALRRFHAAPAGVAPTTTTAAGAQPAVIQASAAPKVGPAQATKPGDRSTAAPSAKPAANGPDAGVYLYATQGYEDTNALGGARHDYPAESPVTVQQSGCGWSERWQPLDQRWDEWTLCPSSGGVYGSHFTTFHEFFKKTQQQDLDCSPSNFFAPVDAHAGQSWWASCSGSPGTVQGTTSVVGFETLTIGGTAVRSLHIHFDLQFSGSNRGRGLQDRWQDATTGLLLKLVTDLDLQSSSPFGDVHYGEHYHLDLSSLRPQR